LALLAATLLGALDTVAGVTLFDGEDSTESPSLFVARTVNV